MNVITKNISLFKEVFEITQDFFSRETSMELIMIGNKPKYKNTNVAPSKKSPIEDESLVLINDTLTMNIAAKIKNLLKNVFNIFILYH